MDPNTNYISLIQRCLRDGNRVLTRCGYAIEFPYPNVTQWQMDMPVITLESRKLNYSFMAAEAAMILKGSNDLGEIRPWCRKMHDFSDDGFTLAGAYGPPVMTQLPYVVDTLRLDLGSRQAVLTIWHPRPRPSKDIPCTISLHFMVRDCKLNCIAHMRSSDIFLGVPYDVFNFSMIAHRVLLMMQTPSISIGTLFLVANNQHLYDSNGEAVGAILDAMPTACQIYAPCKFVDIGHQLDAIYDMRHTGNIILS